jgi:hypothetical protein
MVLTPSFLHESEPLFESLFQHATSVSGNPGLRLAGCRIACLLQFPRAGLGPRTYPKGKLGSVLKYKWQKDTPGRPPLNVGVDYVYLLAKAEGLSK